MKGFQIYKMSVMDRFEFLRETVFFIDKSYSKC